MSDDQTNASGEAWDAALRLAFRSPGGETPTAAADDASPIARLPGDLLSPGLPRRHGRYLVERELARGGMGRVLLARDEDLRRPVALKVLPEIDDAGRLARFLAEARVVAGLEHPGIVAVHEFGLDEAAHPFFTMRLVEGRTFAEELAGADVEGTRRPRRLEVLEKVAEAVACAHAGGVVHRDLKPENVMIGAYGEVLVVDWGLAVTRDGAGDHGLIAGTPAYMAPEQARGDGAHDDPRGDVFALGAMLCEVITGAPPHAAGARLSDVTEGIPAATAALLDASIAQDDLAALALSCLALDAAGRPADADTVARALRASRRDAESRAAEARVAEAAASARAESERRLRRLTMLAGLLAVTLTVTVAWLSRRADRLDRERLVRTETAVQEILDDASLRITVSDWQGALDLCAHAERLVRAENAEHVLARIAATGSRIEEARAEDAASRERQTRDQRLCARIDAALALPADSFGTGRAELENAFLDRGIDVLSSREAAAEVILALDEALHPSVLRALDHWASRLRPGTMERRRILDVALEVDRRPWSTQLRRAVLDENHDALKALARDLDPFVREAPELELLALSLLDAGDREAAIAVFRAAIEAHPGDFWLHLRLCATLAGLDREGGHKRIRVADEVIDEALAHADIALALRPESTVVPWLVSRIHSGRGEREDAERVLNAAARRAPDDAGLLVERARLLRLDGRVGEMFAIAREAVLRDPADEWARTQLRRARELGGADESLDAWRAEVSSWGDEVPDFVRHAELGAVASWTGDAVVAVEHLEAARTDGRRLSGDLILAHLDALLMTGRFEEAERLVEQTVHGLVSRRLERRLESVTGDDTALGRARRVFYRGDVDTAAALYDEHFDALQLPLESRRASMRPGEQRLAARDAMRALVAGATRAAARGEKDRARRYRDRARNVLERELRASRLGLSRMPRPIVEAVRTNLFLRLSDGWLSPVREHLGTLDDPTEMIAWKRLWSQAHDLLQSP